MKINIASFGGRSHLLDTARELEKFGHTVRFYSYVPTKRAVKFGLKKECNYSFFYWALPFLFFFKVCSIFKLRSVHRYIYYLYKRMFDYITAWIMKPCDVFIGQSPMHVYSLKYAKKKYSAITILERGSVHVLEYIKAAEGNPALKGKTPMPKLYLDYDLEGYKHADYISIASMYQKRSFLEYNYPKEKLFVNPYGASLRQFYPTDKPTDDAYDVIFVGNWSYLKGCDLIVETIRRLNIRFLHVGSIIDLEFPKDINFTHINPVAQSELINYYKQAKVFILPSRTDGFGMVLSQAISCGLPIVCSKNTGAPDLKDFLDDKKWIIEMQEYTVDELGRCIKESLKLADTQPAGKRDYAGDALKDNLLWEAYGKRYNDFLTKINK